MNGKTMNSRKGTKSPESTQKSPLKPYITGKMFL
jgi:hypothetical protein